MSNTYMVLIKVTHPSNYKPSLDEIQALIKQAIINEGKKLLPEDLAANVDCEIQAIMEVQD